MNRVYRTKWSAAHQQYVVTDEHHASKGKASKSAIAIAVAALMMAAGAQAAYYEGDTSFEAKNSVQFNAAKQSFETAEYNANWGLKAMKASTAYALGYHGQGVKVGMMDSGILQGHSEFSDKNRWHDVKVDGHYSADGERYPQYAYQGKKPDGTNKPGKDTGKYTANQEFSVATLKRTTTTVLVAQACTLAIATVRKCTAWPGAPNSTRPTRAVPTT